MIGLRLIADDLTGALDSACAFTTVDATVRIGLPGKPIPEGPRVAVSTESRSMTADEAKDAVSGAVTALQTDEPDVLWFKKIDSVMRGHPFVETKAVMDAGAFDACVFAPAYPAMGRLTRNGRQYVKLNGRRDRAVGPKFREAFERLGLEVADNGEGPPKIPRIHCLDAGSQTKLIEHARNLRNVLEGSATLWVGTGGLASALGGGARVGWHPPIAGIVVGTTHPVTREQLATALAAGHLRSLEKQGDAPIWLLAPIDVGSSSETEAIIRTEISRLQISEPARASLVVTGGDTLSIVLDSVAAEFLECYGEAMTGVPLSRIRGGVWDGLTVLSKSGGFGTPDLLIRLIS